MTPEELEERHARWLASLSRAERIRRWLWLHQEGLWWLFILACLVLALLIGVSV